MRDGQSFVTNSKIKANLLNRFFHTAFETNNDINSPQVSGPSTPPSYFTNIQLAKCEVASVLKRLAPNKACGTHGIPNRLLKNVADELAQSLCAVFNLSLSLGVFPTKWKYANIDQSLRRTT